MRAHPSTGPEGNRVALAGALLYLGEWVVLALFRAGGPVLPESVQGRALVEAYTSDPGNQSVTAGALGIVLLGRLGFAAGVVGALWRVGRSQALLAWALAAMVVSVVVEIACYGIAGAAGWRADHGAGVEELTSLNALAMWLDGLLFGPFGLSVALLAVVMLRSAAFARWLCWVGLVSGACLVVYGPFSVRWLTMTGTTASVVDTLSTLGIVGSWVWMLTTGVVLFRRTPGRLTSAGDPPESPEAAAPAAG
ncbi:MAG: hypothetical protein ACTHKG_10960 [Nocardioides sp.]